MSDWNTAVIEEFRANEGKVSGPFEHMPLLLLHHTGAKSGAARVNPLAYQRLDDDSVAIFASKGGSPTNPDWYHNLVAHPEVEVELGTERYRAVARVAGDEERDRIYAAQRRQLPNFGEYEEKAAPRKIPVVVLDRA